MTGPSKVRQTVLILDFGSQYTQLIARVVRELGVYSEIVPFDVGIERVKARLPAAIVLSGGPSSCYEDGAPDIDDTVFSLGVPVLGVCYGAQLMAKKLGGTVEQAPEREYGAALVSPHASKGLFAGFTAKKEVRMWMSHGDKIMSLPAGFDFDAESANCKAAAFSNCEKKLYGVQFHPEVVHSDRGRDILANFLFDVSGLAKSWTTQSLLESSVARIQNQVEKGGTVICGLSGGVDSSVVAALLDKAIGKRLVCIFVDTGLLRKNERERVAAAFRDHFTAELRVVDARERFLTKLADVSDPETKRKRIGVEFIRVFEEESASVDDGKWLAQGTLYPDVIESVSSKGPAAVIKSHHNVGGLPEDMKFELVEPLRELFKDEVRQLGRALGLPEDMVNRHPFPGPGLALRCIGPVSEERLAILREADAIVEEVVRDANLYDDIWQLFGVLLPVKTVGVMGDQRTYADVFAVRAVEAVDGMTADWFQMPYEVLATISSRVVNEVRGINRVVYDITSKPPGTIEWE